MIHQIQFALLVRRLTLRRQTREQILVTQTRRWQRLLRLAHTCSPFYRRRLSGIDLDRCRPEEIPPLTKAEMMDHFDEVATEPLVRRAEVERFIADPNNIGRYFLGKYAVCHTSGSVGRPALVVQRRQDLMTNIAVHIARGQVIPDFKRYVIEHLLRPARLATVTQKPGFYPSGSTFAYLAGLRQFGMRLLLQSVFAPIEEQVARLNDFRPEHLTGYTSALEALAREEIAGRLRLRSGGLQQVTNIAEPLPPDSRAFIEGAFGVHISDCYSAAECLAMTSGCPHFAGSHVNLDLARVEIVDDRYRPVPDGEAGARLLVTNLYNTVVPLIRYELGDAATMSRSPCPCGSPLPLVQSVAGRTKERFWAEIDGRVRELPYYLFLAGLHHYLDLAEHQVVQTGWNRFTVRVAPVRNKTLSADRVRNLVADSLRAEGLLDVIDFSVEILDTIAPDAQTGKIRRAVNLFGPPPSEPEHRQPRQKEGPLEPLKGRS